jgi:ribonucleoside-diphosphate reductase alpha chain
MTAVPNISQRIWDMKYRLKSAAGKPVDKSLEDTWHRVARSLAAPESEPGLWEQHFYRALEDFHFIPAGRILAGAGARRQVTLFNCFVMGTVPDDMAGIFQQLKEAALTLQQGGGIGYDFSTLRPKGAPVRGVGADASGPLSFMEVWDAMCHTILSAGARRGAMMATLRCDHPDIEDFITAKQTPGRLTMFNLSVLVTDAFMTAVREDAPWELTFGGKVFRSLPARELWERIMRATYAASEPGVIFIDRINRRNNLWYCEKIYSTNPCITGDTWVLTTEGPRQACKLTGRRFTAVVNGQAFSSEPEGFFATGIKPVLQITTVEGLGLRLTEDHLVRRAGHRTRWSLKGEWVSAGELQVGDRILLSDHGEEIAWQGQHTEDEGYLIGLLIGDGTIKSDKAVLSVWPGRRAVNGGFERPGAQDVMEAALSAARSLPHRSDFRGWIEVPGRGEFRLALAAIKKLAVDLGIRPGRNSVGPALERSSSAFHRGFLRGLFDADGSVQGSQDKGVSVRLSQSNLDTLRAVQRMLLRQGIASRIYPERRKGGLRMLPDGRGGRSAYQCAPDHELVISKTNLSRFARRIGFTDGEKKRRLDVALGAYKRRLNRERFLARVETIARLPSEPVYDVRIPGMNAFDANGFHVHNCGEQPLPPYGACLLGSINLARLVERPFRAEAKLDLARLEELVPLAVRMLDNAIDVSRFPLKQQKEEALAKRRIGLGITGLADALIMCGARYGGAAAVDLTGKWMRVLQRSAYLASTGLAQEKGAFPLYDRKPYLEGETIDELDQDVKDAIAAHGMRNALVTSVAPTGTISLMAGNVSSGVEPVFSFTHQRAVRQPDGSYRTEQASDYAYALYRESEGEDAPLPDAFVDAQSLDPAAHLVMQAAVQKHVDSSVSKTINLPAGIAFEAFKDVYQQAYDLGCKGCTTYRPNPITGAVLEPTMPGPAAEVASPQGQGSGATDSVVFMTQPLARPQTLPGRTYKLRWPESDHAIYVTVNDVVQDGRRRPFEIFINSKNMEHYAWTVALTRMISAVFRRGGDVSFVVEELKAVFDPRGGAWLGGRYKPSLLAAIGEIIEQHMIDIGFLAAPEAGPQSTPQSTPGEARQAGLRQCPQCGAAALIRQEGCDLCTSCSYTKCS